MPTVHFTVILVVLAGALLHATWNIIIKSGGNKLFETGMKCLGGGLGALCILPFLPPPARESWKFLALSCFFHIFYYICVAATYRTADLSVGYTIMRGSAPLFTALVLCLLGNALGIPAWIGVLTLCAGILSLALEQKYTRRDMKGILYSLRTSAVIMCYTLADGYGAKASGAGVAYACWLFVLNLFPINIYLAARYGGEYLTYVRKRLFFGLGGGLASLGAYGTAIWAMAQAPIVLVAALRETSVIFGMIMAILFLGERLTLLRCLAVLLVALGAALLRFG